MMFIWRNTVIASDCTIITCHHDYTFCFPLDCKIFFNCVKGLHPTSPPPSTVYWYHWFTSLAYWYHIGIILQQQGESSKYWIQYLSVLVQPYKSMLPNFLLSITRSTWASKDNGRSKHHSAIQIQISFVFPLVELLAMLCTSTHSF